MSDKVNAIGPLASVPVAGTGADDPDSRPCPGPDRKAAGYRLVIEPGPRPGTYVYKTVDHATGEMIRQFPREELVKLAEDPLYQTGKIARTSV